MTLKYYIRGSGGFSLFELVMTLAVLSVMSLAALPLLQNSVKRQKEQELRETLRDIRSAIDEFKRDSVGACPGNMASSNLPDGMRSSLGQGQGQGAFDPRSRVIVDDCKIFTSDNLDRYPPTLEDLVNGVRVRSRIPPANNFTKEGVFDGPNATEINENKEVIKKYLRALPKDPITGTEDWDIRSSYQDKDTTDWDKINVFDVRSKSKAEAMNGDKYSDW